MALLSMRLLDVEIEDNTSSISGPATAPLMDLIAAWQFAQDNDPERELSQVDLEFNIVVAFAQAGNLLLEPGEVLARDEIAALHLYTQESPLNPILNARLRDRNRERIRPLIPLVKLLLTAPRLQASRHLGHHRLSRRQAHVESFVSSN